MVGRQGQAHIGPPTAARIIEANKRLIGRAVGRAYVDWDTLPRYCQSAPRHHLRTEASYNLRLVLAWPRLSGPLSLVHSYRPSRPKAQSDLLTDDYVRSSILKKSEGYFRRGQ
jgi:hypothetical protein